MNHPVKRPVWIKKYATTMFQVSSSKVVELEKPHPRAKVKKVFNKGIWMTILWKWEEME